MVAMQIAASPEVMYVNLEDIPQEDVDRETALEMQSEDLEGKPEAIKEKMVAGRIAKLMKTKVLLEQPYIKEPKQTVDEWIK